MRLALLAAGSAAVCASGLAQTSLLSSQPYVSSPIAATITVRANEVAQMPATFIGLKFSKSEIGKATQFFATHNIRGVDNLRALSPLAGQSCILELGSDGTKWVPNGPGHTAGEVAPADIQALAGFLEATNCKLDYSAEIINNTPANAANELAYVSQTIPAANLLAVGFGNEPDDYKGQNSTSYARLWNTFARTALAQDNKLVFKGPDTAVASSLGSWLGSWYAANKSLPLAYGSQHYYINGPAGCTVCTIPTMLEQRSSEAYWSKMVLQKNEFEAGLQKPLPIYLNETNNFYSGGAPGVSNSFASALYAYDFIMQAAEGGFSGSVFMNSDHYSKGYSPLNVIEGYSYGPLPEYYGLYMAAMAGYGPMLFTTVQNGNGVHAYTIKNKTDNDLDVAIVNTTNSNYEFSVELPAGTEIKSCLAYELADSEGPADVSDTALTLQGGHFNSSSQISLGAPFSVSVSNGAASISAPAYSGLLLKCAE